MTLLGQQRHRIEGGVDLTGGKMVQREIDRVAVLCRRPYLSPQLLGACHVASAAEQSSQETQRAR